jgi:hypothetical protein
MGKCFTKIKRIVNTANDCLNDFDYDRKEQDLSDRVCKNVNTNVNINNHDNLKEKVQVNNVNNIK